MLDFWERGSEVVVVVVAVGGEGNGGRPPLSPLSNKNGSLDDMIYVR